MARDKKPLAFETARDRVIVQPNEARKGHAAVAIGPP